MGKEESSIPPPNRSFRKPPPSLSAPGAHHMGGPDPEFGGGSSASSKAGAVPSSKMGADPRTAAERKKAAADPTLAKMKSNRSNDGTATETSIQDSAGPSRIPLEVDHFDRTKPQSKLHWIIPLVLIVITAILAVVIPVSVIMTREEEVVERPVQENTPAPIAEKANMTLAELQEFVPGANEAMLQIILEDKFSPQYLALEWAMKDPNNWTEYEDWRKIQRYAMTVVFYSLDGPSWNNAGPIRILWLRHHKHECDWGTTNDHAGQLCDDENRLFNLRIPRLEYLRGVLPLQMAMLPHVQIIDLTGCNLGQDIDNFFSVLLQEDKDLSHFLPSLDTLVLSDTEMTGTVPSFLTTLPKLSHLDVSINSLTSTIPSELGLLTNLESVLVSRNELTGTVPSELGDLSLLSTLALEENKLDQGPLPEGLCSKDHVTWIQLETDWCQSSDECCSFVV